VSWPSFQTPTAAVVAHRRHRPRGSPPGQQEHGPTLAEAAGIPVTTSFFNIERVGNTSSASILLAVHDAVQEGRIDRPMRVFAPGSGPARWWVRRHAGRPRSGELKF